MMRPPPLLLHVAHGVLDGRVDGGEVHLDHLVPVVVVEHIDGALRVAVPLGRHEAGPRVDAGIGEDHVNSPMPVRHCVECRCHPAAIGHVHGLAPDVTALGPPPLQRPSRDRWRTISKMQTRAPLSAITSA